MQFPKLIKIAVRTALINNVTAVASNYMEMSFARVLSQWLGFSLEAVAPADGQWGSRLPDGNWTGMVGLLQRNEADLIIYTLSITEERRQVIDFSYPYRVQGLVFATNHLEPTIDDGSFLKPFTLGVWLFIWTFAFLLPLLYSILFRRRKISCGRFRKGFRSFQRPAEVAPKKFAECFLRTCQLFLETLFKWSYAAVLLSFLTFPTLTGVRNNRQLARAVRQGKYMCTTYPGAGYAHIFLQSDDEDLKTIGGCLIESRGHSTLVEIMSDTNLQKKVAYIGTEAAFAGLRIKYFISEDGLFPDYLAVGVRRGFCCRPQLDSALHDIWAAGIYNKLSEEYYRRKKHHVLWPSSDVKTQNGAGRRLSLLDFQGIFFLLAAGHLLAIAVFFIELTLEKAASTNN